MNTITNEQILRLYLLKEIGEPNKGVKFYVKYKDGKREVRKFWKDSSRCVYCVKKGSRTLGFYAGDIFLSKVESLKVKRETDTFSNRTYRKRFEKAYEMLDRTGLWSSIKDSIRKILDMDEKEFSLLCEIGTGRNKDHNLYNEIHKDGGMFTHISGLGSDLCFSFFAKKCFVTPRWGIRQEYKDKVRNAINGREEINLYWVDGYDNSISVFKHKDELCANYSEEFRGTGNGHYYLMFDATHAIHYEDD